MNRYTLALLAAVGALYLGTCTEDYNIELASDAHYVDMVCAGHWPDYKNQAPACP